MPQRDRWRPSGTRGSQLFLECVGTRYAPVTEKSCGVGGRGATARPREAEWNSRLAAAFGCVITKIFSKIQMTTTTSQAYYLVYNRDMNR